MAKKKILTIGFELADSESEFCEFNSDISLLDWDIILFKPDISEYIYSRESMFQGKPCLSDTKSFQLRSQTEHWRREINSAVESGKLVIVYLSELKEISIATGEKRFSGTGRNQKTTRIVGDFDNYRSLPVSINWTKTKGKEIKLASKGAEVLSSYWSEFASVSSYNVLLECDFSPCLLTKHGDKTVGTVIRPQHPNGALILLPDIDFYPDEFFGGDDGEDWANEGKQFATKFIKSILAIDKSLRAEGELTPEPEWAKDSTFKLKEELDTVEKLMKVETKLEAIQLEKEALLYKNRDLGRLRNLLFEKGKPLEFAILGALKVIGFNVSQYDDGNCEFDAVFESKEGRLIGEAEGKDNKAINIDKLRQLALNIHEDLELDNVEVPAKGVLFGNAYRMQAVEERNGPFTTKCISAAITSSTALVFTPDLFTVAKYLSDKRDSRFATKCRKAILNSVGRVEFPEIPENTISSSKINLVDTAT
ncbi:hypothetical protein EDB62_101140 [Vibrio crassostreae]|uniref:hypothetical protein n=1 Tax=Vibrio crassostreae TaxID=246167 RepID=UPI0010515FCA|nr:hypothetical protein [Vibrio crassostreae]TCN79878.1 hypothetical protein EDB62_101140 [Vibrio crassostreae]TWD73775.1 hypothetical protein FB445_101142 [Vibrio crassostreae]